MIEKSDSPSLALATITIFGQAPGALVNKNDYGLPLAALPSSVYYDWIERSPLTYRLKTPPDFGMMPTFSDASYR